MADAIQAALKKLKKPGDRATAKFESQSVERRQNAFYQRIYREACKMGFQVGIRTVGADVHLQRKEF